ncbi:MAG: TetR/AcrR family transcriptional regulator [Bacillota bacterium]
MGKREITKNRIIDAATWLFTVHGYDAVSVEDITKSAAIAKGTFYYHFNKKDDLLLFLIEENFKKLFDELHEIRDNAALTAAGKLEQVTRALFSRDFALESFKSYFSGKVPAQYEADIKTIRLKYLLPLISSIVDGGIKNGIFRIKNGQVISHIVTYGITEFIYRNYESLGDEQYYLSVLKGFEELFNIFLTAGSEPIKLV